ncbi:MAG: hypothetical protein SFV15_16985 [Polyangiaceae bacterium]|nr:hypothetical protein [Polyangiaceae bacterium]
MTDPAPELTPRALRASIELDCVCSAWAQEILGLREHDPEQNFATPWGDLNELLNSEHRTTAQRRLLALALAVGAQSLLEDKELTSKMIMARFVELAHAGKINALGVVDEVFGAEAASLWRAIPLPPSKPLRTILVDGQLLDPPRPAWLTGLLGLSAILLIRRIGSTLGRWLLGYRTPARLRVVEMGLELRYRRQFLGRTLAEVTFLVPMDELSRLTREVRYRGALLYAGLSALVLGSYLGAGMVLDGLRVPNGSLPLITTGVLAVLAGLALDFVSTTAFDSFRGRNRLCIQSRSGFAFSLGDVSPKEAESLLGYFQLDATAGVEAQPSAQPGSQGEKPETAPG